MTGEARPPLWTWPAALLLGFAGVAACWAVAYKYGPVYDFQFLNLERLSVRSASPTIVVIGSSRTRCAVESDREMTARLARLGTPAHVVRITKGAATLRDYSKLFQMLPSVRPSVVAIESELATLEPHPFREREAAQYTGWREQSRHGFAALLSPASVQRHGRENWKALRSQCEFPFNAKIVAHRQELLAERHASSQEERQPVIDLAHKLNAIGVPFILLDLPNRTDEMGRRPAALESGERQAMQQLIATGLFYHFDDPPKLDPSAFEDAGHLRPTGQARTSAWLAQRLSAMLRTGERR